MESAPVTVTEWCMTGRLDRPIIAGDMDDFTYSGPTRGIHYCDPDGRGYRDHVHSRRTSLSGRYSPALSVSVPDQSRMVTRAVHLHVHLDGEVRRRLRRPNRHPRWRRCADQPTQ